MSGRNVNMRKSTRSKVIEWLRKWLLMVVIMVFSAILFILFEMFWKPAKVSGIVQPIPIRNLEFKVFEVVKEVEAEVSAFNTVPEQTDDFPCLAASGANICGKKGILACPRPFPFGTIFLIGDKEYICMDRMGARFEGRFDVSFDKDIQGAREWGMKKMVIRQVE